MLVHNPAAALSSARRPWEQLEHMLESVAKACKSP